MTCHSSRWSAEGDKDFGDAGAKIYSGFEVPPEWITAADFAVTKMVSKGRGMPLWRQMERGIITRARTGLDDLREAEGEEGTPGAAEGYGEDDAIPCPHARGGSSQDTG